MSVAWESQLLVPSWQPRAPSWLSGAVSNSSLDPTISRTARACSHSSRQYIYYLPTTLGCHCWRSLTIISRRQLDQKIMRVWISHTHPYPIKSLNHTLPFRICKLCFQANMQVISTLWPNTKSQKYIRVPIQAQMDQVKPKNWSKPSWGRP